MSENNIPEARNQLISLKVAREHTTNAICSGADSQDGASGLFIKSEQMSGAAECHLWRQFESLASSVNAPRPFLLGLLRPN